MLSSSCMFVASRTEKILNIFLQRVVENYSIRATSEKNLRRRSQNEENEKDFSYHDF